MPDERLETDALDESLPSNRESTSGSPLPGWAAVGALSGFALLGLICVVLLPEKQSLATVSARALSYTAACGAAGAAVVAGLWAAFRPGRVAAPPGFVQVAAEACTFLPCMVLLQMKQSFWMLACAALTTLIFWRGLRPLVGQDASWKAFEPAHQDEFAALYGLPKEKLPLGWMVFLAVCVQAAGIAASAGFLGWASALLSLWLLALMWRWREIRAKRRVYPQSDWRQFGGITGLAFLLTIFFLLPPRQGGGGAADARDRALSRDADGNPGQRGNGEGYAGIILLPPPVKKQKIVAPKPRASLFAAGHSEPLVIPFDGAYWYFKAPAKRPSARARVAQGKATEVNVRSSDRYPLLMEAHQSLGAPIDLECCREIEVALTNADTRPGTIAIGVILTDTTSPPRPHELLGMKTLPSSDLPEIPAGREAVEETMRFPIPRGLKRCDEITVVFVPSRERERTGAKVSVRSFALLPR